MRRLVQHDWLLLDFVGNQASDTAKRSLSPALKMEAKVRCTQNGRSASGAIIGSVSSGLIGAAVFYLWDGIANLLRRTATVLRDK
jgi:hypothetical protein